MRATKKKGKKMKTFRDDWDEFAKAQVGEKRYNEAIAKAKIEIQKIKLKQLRESLGVKQNELKGLAQSEVSKIERRKDMKISTIVKYAESLGFKVLIEFEPLEKK
jgi:hypothetical protein